MWAIDLDGFGPCEKKHQAKQVNSTQNCKTNLVGGLEQPRGPRPSRGSADLAKRG